MSREGKKNNNLMNTKLYLKIAEVIYILNG